MAGPLLLMSAFPIPFSIRLAMREGRSGFRRIGVFLASVALGVAALVGLYAFQKDAGESARTEARAILGGDLRLQSQSPFPHRAEAVIDSLRAEGANVSRAVSMASMVAVPGTGRARLLQVTAVDGAFPLPGGVRDAPEGSWASLAELGGVAADPSVLRQLGVEVGDTVQIGAGRFVVRAAVSGLPVDLGLQSVVGPPLFLALSDLPETGLLGFGSLAQYRAFVDLPPGSRPEAFRAQYRGEFRTFQLSVRTAREEAEDLARGFRDLSRFLGLVGLMALLVGGIGVASAVHVYVRERIASIAVLRCLGARQGTAFRAYLLQATGLGAGGAAVGVLLGLAIQWGLPVLLRPVLPFEVRPYLHPEAVVAGLGVGIGVALLFAFLPLLRIREVSPLAALRSEVEFPTPSGTTLALRGAAWMALVLGFFGLTVLQLGDLRAALAFTGGLVGVMAALAGVAWVLSWLARHLVPRSAPFPLRQGIAGLFRPGNQTGTILVSIGFGSFLVGSLLVVESNLREALSFDAGGGGASLLLFDIQPDQRPGVEALLSASGSPPDLFAIVPSRIAEVNGVPVAEIVDTISGGRGWSYRRLFRNTWREELGPMEVLLEGAWWEGRHGPVVEAARSEGVPLISIEVEVAAEIGVGIGDRITWDVQGVQVPSVVASLRMVDWASFQPNFFVIFEPGALDGAPATFVGLASPSDPSARDRLQSSLLGEFPNVSFLDISAVRETLTRIASRITLVLRAMAGFVVGAGLLVLLASLLTTRFSRRREGALLRTLGATRGVVHGVLLAEYMALGAIGGAAGLVLGAGGGVGLLRWGFELTGAVPWGALLGMWAAVLVLTVLVGWTVSGPILRDPPLVVLRAEG